MKSVSWMKFLSSRWWHLTTIASCPALCTAQVFWWPGTPPPSPLTSLRSFPEASRLFFFPRPPPPQSLLKDCFLWYLSILQWYNHTDYPIFSQYQRYRRLHPQQPFYILHPRFEWQLWQRIQDNMAEPIQKNPPSSGLLGRRKHICLTTSRLCWIKMASSPHI